MAQIAAREAIEKLTKEAAEKAAKEAAEQLAKDAAKNLAKEAAENALKSGDVILKEVAEKTAREAAEKAAKEAAEKVLKEGGSSALAKEVAEKAGKEAAERAAKESGSEIVEQEAKALAKEVGKSGDEVTESFLKRNKGKIIAGIAVTAIAAWAWGKFNEKNGKTVQITDLRSEHSVEPGSGTTPLLVHGATLNNTNLITIKYTPSLKLNTKDKISISETNCFPTMDGSCVVNGDYEINEVVDDSTIKIMGPDIAQAANQGKFTIQSDFASSLQDALSDASLGVIPPTGGGSSLDNITKIKDWLTNYWWVILIIVGVLVLGPLLASLSSSSSN